MRLCFHRDIYTISYDAEAMVPGYFSFADPPEANH
jgi:hypothetical protein